MIGMQVKAKGRGRSARRSTGATIAATAVLLGLLVGCGGDDGGAATAGGPGDAGSSRSDDATDFDPDATFRVGTNFAAQNLDPHVGRHPAEITYTTMIYDRLLTTSADGAEIQPMLATAWELVDDGAAMELTLRDDVTFHDGTPFDAEAVAANVERAQTVPESSVADRLTSIDDVTVVDTHTVRFELVEGRGAELPAFLATSAGMMVSPAALAEGRDLSLDPGDAGSGPYRVTEFRAGEGATYERVDDHWDGSVHRARYLEVTMFADYVASLNGLRSGQLDLSYIAGPTVDEAVSLLESGEVAGYSLFARVPNALVVNSTTAPLDDQAIRQAIGHAIDKQAIADGLFDGHCLPTGQPYEEGHWAHVPEIEELTAYDPDRSRALLEESGLDSVRVTLEVAAGGASQPVAEAIQQQLDEVGIDAEVSLVPQAEVFGRFAEGDSMASVLGLIPAADPSTWVNDFLTSSYDLARQGGEPRERIEELALEALDPSLDQGERATRYEEIQRIVADQAWVVPICQPRYVFAASSDAVGVDDQMEGLWTGLPDFSDLGKVA